MNEGCETAQAEMLGAGRQANAAQQWGGECGLSIPMHLPANAMGTRCLEKKPDLGGGQEGAGREARPKVVPEVLSTGNQLCCAGEARTQPSLSSPCQKKEGLAVSTEINPYGNPLSDATLCRRFLFPITLLISARKINRGKKAIGSKNI